MSNMTQEIRDYVKKHDNEVTFDEVENYVLNEKHIITTEKAIRQALFRVLKELGGILKRKGMTQEVRDYIKEHDNEVTFDEVKNYVLNKKHIKVTENAIRQALCRVLKESGGTLKRTGMTQEIRDYVKEHDNEVTFAEIKNYILNEKHIMTTEATIRTALFRVRREL